MYGIECWACSAVCTSSGSKRGILRLPLSARLTVAPPRVLHSSLRPRARYRLVFSDVTNVVGLPVRVRADDETLW